MATVKISALPSATVVAGTSPVPLVYSGVTYGANLTTIGAFVTTNAVTVSASGNITGSYILGNGSQLSGIDATSIQSGTSNVKVVSSGGNVTVGVAGTSNVVVVDAFGTYITGNLSVSGNATLSGNILGDRVQNGSTSFDIQVASGNANITVAGTSNVAVFATTGEYITGLISANGTVTGGNLATGGTASATGNITGGNVLTGGLISASGNITGSYFLGDGSQLSGIDATSIQSGTSNVKVVSSGGNATVGIGGTSNVAVFATTGEYVTGLISASGNVIGGNVITAGILTVNSGSAVTAIVNGGSNAVGNIGSSGGYFNRIFAQATTALYADVAERFASDDAYTAGTVVELGGAKEITKTMEDLSENVFGVISTQAAYLMNGAAGSDETHPPVAITGRVPVQVIGKVKKGDRLVSAGNGMARAAAAGEATSFNVIGRSLVNKTTSGVGTVEAIVVIN